LIKDWYYYYISYDDLKESLNTPYETAKTPENPHPKRKEWTPEDEERFVTELEAELDKVFTFQRVKSGEIVRRIKASEKEVSDVVGRLDSQGPTTSQANGHAVEMPTEDDFMLLEEDLSDVIADVHDLAKFTQLNYTGFQKIIKKHDVSLGGRCPDQELMRVPETNLMASQACFCDSIKSQAFFQGQLRRLYCEAFEAV
jgi:SPX domain protein involved in polyphosphate accumulation